MVGIIDVSVVGCREPACLRRLQFETIIPQIARQPLLVRGHPNMVKISHPGGFADHPEAVDIAVVDPRPIFEQDAELKGGLSLTHELALIQPDQAMECPRGGNGRFADADGPDFLRLDQRDVEQRAELRDERRRGDPASGAATGNYDALDPLIFHNALSCTVASHSGGGTA